MILNYVTIKKNQKRWIRVTKVIATPGRTKEIIKKYNLKLKKSLGQNFLIDNNIINIILEAGNISPDDKLIEIGPGIGSLTQGLLVKLSEDGKLYAVEKDKRMTNILSELFDDNRLEVINRDVLEIDWKDFFSRNNLNNQTVKVLANLPYYITSPIIMSILESMVRFDSLIFMVQKEVAERMAAEPGDKDYGILSIAVQYYSLPEIVHIVSPEVFIPRPGVSSAIIKLKPYKTSPIKVLNRKYFFQIVKAVFQQRRKNIKNGLTKAANINLEKKIVLKSLSELDVDPRIRGEKLSVSKFAELSNLLYKYKKDGE